MALTGKRGFMFCMIALIALFCLNCNEESGCPEGQHMRDGVCIPDSTSNNPPSTDGDSSVYIPDGDGSDVVIDGDDTENVSSDATCSDPIAYAVEDRRQGPKDDSGSLVREDSALDGVNCDWGLSAVDGDGGGPGVGPELVAAVYLFQGEQLTATFTSSENDDVMYVLSDCSQGATCVAQVDALGTGLGEELEFISQADGTYYLVMDTKQAGSSYSYSYRFFTSVAQVDGDTVDGDATDGDAVDGDSIDGDQVDGDTVFPPDGDIDGELPMDYPNLARNYSVAASTSVPGIFTDLGWVRNGDAYDLYIVNDDGYATMPYDNEASGSLGTAVFSASDSLYRGVIPNGNNESQPIFLDADSRKVTPLPQGDISLPVDLAEPTALTELNGDYWVTDSGYNRIYRFVEDTGQWTSSYFEYPEFSNLVGITAQNGTLYVLNQDEDDSDIYEIDPATGKLLMLHRVLGVKLTGIAANPLRGNFWATSGTQRSVVYLEAFTR